MKRLMWATGVLLLTGAVAAVRGESGLSQLALRIDGPSSAVVGEPVALTFTLANQTLQPVLAHRHLDPLEGFLQLYIAAPGGAFRRFLDPRWGTRHLVTGPEAIEPGEPLVSRVEILENHHLRGDAASLESATAFPQPGTYRLKARLLDLDYSTAVESNVLEIHLRPGS